MFLIQSEKDLLEAFFPRDQRRLELPKNVKYPLVVRDYYAWSEPGSPRVNLLFAEPDGRKPLGVIFERESSPTPSAGAICEWCHAQGSTNQIGWLMLEVTDRRRVGVHLCRDLSCREKIETDTSLSPVAAQKRARRVVAEMTRFVRRMLL